MHRHSPWPGRAELIITSLLCTRMRMMKKTLPAVRAHAQTQLTAQVALRSPAPSVGTESASWLNRKLYMSSFRELTGGKSR